MSNKRTIDERLEARREEKRQLEAKIQELLQEQRTHKKKERNHRIFKRGGYIEKYIPEIVSLSDEQFYTFVEKCLQSNFAKRTLSDLMASGDNSDDKVKSEALTTSNEIIHKSTLEADSDDEEETSEEAA